MLVDLALEEVRRGGVPIIGLLALRVEKGESFAILGRSGVGKSTLLRTIAGLERDFDGQRRVTDAVAYIFQEPTLLPWRTAQDNVTLATGCEADAAREMLGQVGLANKEALFPGQLSLGQQRRLSLARAFAAEPELMLMDEPFVSLDAELAEDMLSLYETLRDRHQMTTVFVTHAEEEAARLATRSVTLVGQPARLSMT